MPDYTPTEDEQRVIANFCRYADPRCINDPCPYDIWRALCRPQQGHHHGQD